MTKRLNFKKIARSSGFHLRVEFLLVALALMLISVLSPITLLAADLACQSLFAVFQIFKLNKTPGQGKHARLEQAAMRALLEKHNDYLAEFARWRGLFARQADKLAALIKTFPGGENLSVEELRRIIMQAPEGWSGEKAPQIFQPWTNRWTGLWSNGAPQYHVWDSTRFVNGQWIQPVSLSEFEYVEPGRLEECSRERRADVAINVYTHGHGVTGWVSKYQHGRLELPHVGYVINDSTLLWICQIKSPERLFMRENCWFVFLETVTVSSAPAEDRIYGQPVLIGDDFHAEAGERDLHRGTYYAVAPR
jgi:hypothetical protein